MHGALVVLAQSDWHGHHDINDGWGIGMMAVMVAFWAVIAVAVVWAVRHWTSSTHAAHGMAADEPLRILDRRLAEGDITVEEYTRRRDLLRGGGGSAAS